MRQLKRITVDLFMSMKPCVGCTQERVLEAFGGRRSMTPLEVAGLAFPADVILHVLLREDIIQACDLRLIACWCAERALRVARAVECEHDTRSWAAVRVARMFANGKATAEELTAARDAPRASTSHSIWDAASDSAWASTQDAAGVSAWDAAWDAARVSVWASTQPAGAAWDAAWSATLRHVRCVLRRIA